MSLVPVLFDLIANADLLVILLRVVIGDALFYTTRDNVVNLTRLLFKGIVVFITLGEVEVFDIFFCLSLIEKERFGHALVRSVFSDQSFLKVSFSHLLWVSHLLNVN